MIKTCITCDNFRYLEKGREGRMVLCDLMYEDYKVSVDLFQECFFNHDCCDLYKQMDENSRQELE